MEIRKAQITGGATFMVTLPKEWAEAQELQSGTKMALYPRADGVLLLKPLRETPPRRGKLTLGSKSGTALRREIITLYVAGFDLIEIEGRRSTEQYRVIKETSQRYISVDIIDESADAIVLKALRDEVSLHEWLQRVYRISRTMLSDALDALVTHNKDLAKDVIYRDEEVDRFFLRLSRQLRLALQDPLAEEESHVSRLQLFNYHTAARQLERIADHAVKIARVVEGLSKKLPKATADGLSEMGKLAMETMDLAVMALQQSDLKQAHEVLDANEQLGERFLKSGRLLRDVDAVTAQHLGIVLDSIGRVKDYGTNVAETALNAIVPGLRAS
jgi:phosphate uptake regulator